MKPAFLIIAALLLFGCIQTIKTLSKQNTQPIQSNQATSQIANQTANQTVSTTQQEAQAPTQTPENNAPEATPTTKQATVQTQASTQPVPTPIVTACDKPSECVGEPPDYCADGRVITLCAKCGCPSGKTCGRQLIGGGFKCFTEGEKGPGFEQAPPFLQKSGEPVSQLPTPTPNSTPTSLPQCAASSQGVPGIGEFASQISQAYKQTFNNDLSFTLSDGKRVFYYVGAGLENQVTLSQVGKYYVAYDEVEAEIIASSKSCVIKTPLFQSSTVDKPFKYNFRMYCHSYVVDAKISEKPLPGESPLQLGRKFAEKLADYC